ncbi:hypothetical protein [Azonexus hydrophilus]|uniref:Uncharacterized protein n=1 Tax=Azonexus hydrophilus TaxID=418702 RepID=A0ABZ2XL15_9RHOO
MHHIIEPNGNLTLVVDDDDCCEFLDIRDNTRGSDHGFLADLLEAFGFSTNARLFPVMPQQVGALTDAPMLTDDLEYEEGGEVTVRGRLWWFPAYELKSISDIMSRSGRVTFTLA